MGSNTYNKIVPMADHYAVFDFSDKFIGTVSQGARERMSKFSEWGWYPLDYQSMNHMSLDQALEEARHWEPQNRTLRSPS